MLAGFELANLKDLEYFLHSTCKSKCQIVLKDDQICQEFCRFVNHIAEAHGEQLLKLTSEGLTKQPLVFLHHTFNKFLINCRYGQWKTQ